MNQPDLFDRNKPGRYPHSPGYKAGGTSRNAARHIASHAATVRGHVLAEYRAAHPRGLTADECAKLVGESILTVRPRCSELRAAGLIEPTPETKPNAESGHSARVWRATALAMEISA